MVARRTRLATQIAARSGRRSGKNASVKARGPTRPRRRRQYRTCLCEFLVDPRTCLCENKSIKAAELVRRVRKLGRKSRPTVHYDARHGKGSHGRLYYGGRVTAIIDLKHEIAPGLLLRMCKDLGIDPNDL